MKLVSWNCNGALRNKLTALADRQFDLTIVQECEDPARSSSAAFKQWASNYLWVGENKNRGLGVFAADGIKLEAAPIDPGGLELFLPCRISDDLLVIAVWTRQADSPTFGYIGQLWKFIQLAAATSMVIGDLNSNVRWDKWDRWWNHSDVVRELSGVGMESIYHHCRGVSQGAEPEPTFYLQRNPDKPYHIDYAFAPALWLPSSAADVGSAAEWLEFSDHMPLFVTIPYSAA
jgi:hypothetical protein